MSEPVELGKGIIAEHYGEDQEFCISFGYKGERQLWLGGLEALRFAKFVYRQFPLDEIVDTAQE